MGDRHSLLLFTKIDTFRLFLVALRTSLLLGNNIKDIGVDTLIGGVTREELLLRT